MIQLVARKTELTSWNYIDPMRLNLADKIVGTPIFGTTTIGSDIYYHLEFPHFLYKLESQLTGKTKIFTRPVYFPVVGWNNFSLSTVHNEGLIITKLKSVLNGWEVYMDDTILDLGIFTGGLSSSNGDIINLKAGRALNFSSFDSNNNLIFPFTIPVIKFFCPAINFILHIFS